MRSRALLLLSLLPPGLAACTRKHSPEASTIFPDTSAAALAEAAARGDSARVRELIEAGADPNARGDQGVTLPQWALFHKSTAGIAALLEGGADPALADERGETVVHFAAMANDPKYLDVLLAHHADPNTRNPVTGATPLVSALMGNRDAQFRKLLAAGASPNIVDRLGNTPLHVAAKINAYQRVLDLLQAGADPTARNQRGATFQRYLTTPLEVSTAEARSQRAAIAAWLRDHGVPVEGSRSP